jgi:hypothetical protein
VTGGGGRGWYVYCVTAADQPAPLDGLAGVDPEAGPVDTVTDGEVRAVVSPVRLAEFGGAALADRLEDLTWLGRTARAHDAVIGQVQTGTTVVPLRLCTIFTDRGGVTGMLRRARAHLVDDLRRLRGGAEWSVKVLAAPARVEAALAGEASPGSASGPAGSAEPAGAAGAAGAAAGAGSASGPAGSAEPAGRGGVGGAAGRAYLARRRHQLRRRETARTRIEATVSEVHDRLADLAIDAAVLPPQRPELSGRAGQMVLNGAYLVEQARADRFVAAVDALRQEHGPTGLDVELAGPWAPYNFVTTREADR